MSEPVNGASERSERSEAERCGASERSERWERTNVASDRVANSKRGCLRLEMPSKFDIFKNKYYLIINERTQSEKDVIFEFIFVSLSLENDQI